MRIPGRQRFLQCEVGYPLLTDHMPSPIDIGGGRAAFGDALGNELEIFRPFAK